MPTQKILSISSLFLLIIFTGCLRPQLPAPTTFALFQLDTTPIKGKKIVIDPGHGGTEHGAVGAKGSAESEVNLGVALYLWGLLKAAGARPALTRTSDINVYSGQEFSLKKDLQARSDLSNTYQADLFVSIHHNSATENSRRNDLSIFYKMSDSGRSRDIAREVRKAFKEKLPTKTARTHPGNYHVLRNTIAPAILGEASFMSNKKNETMLSFHRTLSSEAESYFIGILNYYRKGIPRVADFYPNDVTLSNAQPQITASLDPGTDRASIDFSSIKATLDGKNITSFSIKENNSISFVSQSPLENGLHRFCLSARNTSGNFSGEQCAFFSISLPPGLIKIAPLFPVIPADGTARTPIEIEVLDVMNRPVMDGTEVSFSTTGGRLLNPDTLTANGKAQSILIAGDKPQAATVSVKSGNAVSDCNVTFGRTEESLLMATIRDPSGNPVEKAKLVNNYQTIGLSDTTGFIYAKGDASKESDYSIVKRGYHPKRFSPSLSPGKLAVENLLLEPVDKGIFFNRKIILDPAVSSTESPAIIYELKRKIEIAGGNAVLTWEKPPAPSAYKRVLTADKENSDIFLSIEITEDKFSANYYFKSLPGKELATILCRKLMENRMFEGKACEPLTSTRYVIIHTAMPAIWLFLPGSSNSAVESVADSIYAALLEAFSGTTFARPSQ